MKNQIRWLLEDKYNNKPTEQFYKDTRRLEAGEPVDYVIGFTEFLGCKIDLSKKPLIPRPETEFWVDEIIKEVKKMENPSSIRSSGQNLRILDMFAGSGCIGIAVLKHIKNAEIFFADKDKKCSEQIKINLKLNGVRSKFIVRQSDIFSNVKGKFDFIFANPPYIPDYRKNPSARLRVILRNQIQKSVLKYEPKSALFGGGDGLFYIKKFLRGAKERLNQNGQIFMEFSPEQKKEIEKLLEKFSYKSFEFHKDQFGKPRWAVIE